MLLLLMLSSSTSLDEISTDLTKPTDQEAEIKGGEKVLQDKSGVGGDNTGDTAGAVAEVAVCC